MRRLLNILNEQLNSIMIGVLALACVGAVTAAPRALAQAVEVPNEPQPAGQQRAQEYFQDRQKARGDAPARRSEGEGGSGAMPRYMALHIGSFFTSQSYGIGKGNQRDKGELNAGLTYRLGEWVNSADLALRVDYTNFDFREGRAQKLSIGGILTFPDANSNFPLYFGAGLGGGFFLEQLRGESPVAIDYSLIAGIRFFNVIENVGFMAETGLKNSLLLGDGQFNGVYFNVGTVFVF